jgi:hypothetical protein
MCVVQDFIQAGHELHSFSIGLRCKWALAPGRDRYGALQHADCIREFQARVFDSQEHRKETDGHDAKARKDRGPPEACPFLSGMASRLGISSQADQKPPKSERQ